MDELPSQDMNELSDLFDDEDFGDLLRVPIKSPRKKSQENGSEPKVDPQKEGPDLEKELDNQDNLQKEPVQDASLPLSLAENVPDVIRKQPVEDPSLPPSLAENVEKEKSDNEEDDTDPLLDDLLSMADDISQKDEGEKSEVIVKENDEELQIDLEADNAPKEEVNAGDPVVRKPSPPPPPKKKIAVQDIFGSEDMEKEQSDNLDVSEPVEVEKPPEPKQEDDFLFDDMGDRVTPPPSKKNNLEVPKEPKEDLSDFEDIFEPKKKAQEEKPLSDFEDIFDQKKQVNEEPPKKKEKSSPPKKRQEPPAAEENDALITCQTCTFQNKATFIKCAMCDTPLAVQKKTTKACKICTFENSLSAIICQMCNQPFEEEKKEDGSMISCPACTFQQSSENEACEVCGAEGDPFKKKQRKSRNRRQIVCEQCHSKNDPEALMCYNCDQPLNNIPQRKRKVSDAGKIPKKKRKLSRRKSSKRSDDEGASDGDSQGNLDGFVVGDDDVEIEENAEDSEEYDPRDDMGSYSRDHEPDEWGDDGHPYKDGRPICRYGRTCYRDNAAHFEQYAHPWLKK